MKHQLVGYGLISSRGLLTRCLTHRKLFKKYDTEVSYIQRFLNFASVSYILLYNLLSITCNTSFKIVISTATFNSVELGSFASIQNSNPNSIFPLKNKNMMYMFMYHRIWSIQDQNITVFLPVFSSLVISPVYVAIFFAIPPSMIWSEPEVETKIFIDDVELEDCIVSLETSGNYSYPYI